MKFKNLIRLLNYKPTIWIMFLVFALWYTQSKQHLPPHELKQLILKLSTWKLIEGCFVGLFILTYKSDKRLKFYLNTEKFIFGFILLHFLVGMLILKDYFFWMQMYTVLIGYYLAVPLLNGIFKIKVRNYAYFFEFKITKEEKSFICRNIEKFEPIIFTESIQTPLDVFVSSRPFDLVSWLTQTNLRKEVNKLNDEFFYRIGLSLEAIYQFLEDSRIIAQEDKAIYAEEVDLSPEIIKRRHQLETFKASFKEKWKLDPFLEK